MKRERFEQVMRIFEAARERSREHRQRILQKACGGDQVLRGEVESLLAHHDGEGDVLLETAPARLHDAEGCAVSALEKNSVSLTRWQADRLFCRIAIDSGYITHQQAQDFLRGYRHETSKRKVATALLVAKLLTRSQLAVVKRAFEDRLEVLRDRRAKASHESVDPRETAPWLGKTIGEHRVEKLLGRGGMGQVYRARHLQLKHEVALKVLGSGSWGGADLTRRFVREAEISAKLKHPNIVSLHDFGPADARTFYYTMDLVEGEDYASVLKRGAPHPRRVARFLAKVADAVHYAHTKRVIHRDLKPQNIMVNRAGEPVILDFGLAKELDADVSIELSRSGMVIGTLCYMSPEQVDGRTDKVDARSDIYALGAILYESLTGRPPFVGESQLDLMLRIRKDSPISPRQLAPAVPAELEAVCLKCLEKQRSRRYRSAEDLANDLKAFLQNRPVQARPPSVISRTSKFVRRHTALVSATAAVIVSLVIGLAVSIYQWQRAEDALSKVQVAILARDLALGQVEEEKLRTAGLTKYIAGLREEARAAEALREQLDPLRVALRSASEAAKLWQLERDESEKEIQSAREEAQRAQEEAEKNLELYKRAEELNNSYAAQVLKEKENLYEIAGLLEFLKKIKELGDPFRGYWKKAVASSGRLLAAARPAGKEPPWVQGVGPHADDDQGAGGLKPAPDPPNGRGGKVKGPTGEQPGDDDWLLHYGRARMGRSPPTGSPPPTRSRGSPARGAPARGSSYGTSRGIPTGGYGRVR